MKKPIILNLSAIIALNICTPILGSEKNWFTTTIANYAKDTVNTHTYDYLSPKHVGTGLLLSLLPSQHSLALLQKQRANMVTFLRKNEAEALEDVRQYWNYDQETWSNIMNQTEEDLAFNLDALKSTHNYNAPHNPNLPTTAIMAIKHECKRHNFNINNLAFGAITIPSDTFAQTSMHKPNQTSDATKTYIPTEIDLNIMDDLIINQSNLDPHFHSIRQAYTHEFIHVVKGHNIQRKNIISAAYTPIDDKMKQFNDVMNQYHEIMNSMDKKNLFGYIKVDTNEAYAQCKKLRAQSRSILKEIDELKAKTTQSIAEFPHSSAGEKYTAASEKTADTLVACTDPDSAKNGFHTLVGYIDNKNDVKTLHANWQLTQAIKTRQRVVQAFKNTGQKVQNTLRKYMPF